MIQLDLLPKISWQSRLFRPWWDLWKEYVLKFMLAVVLFIGALQLTSEHFICLPVRDSNGTCSVSAIKNNVSNFYSINDTCRIIIDVSLSIRVFAQNECLDQLHYCIRYFHMLSFLFPAIIYLVNVGFYNRPALFYKLKDFEEIILRCNAPDTKLMTSKLQNFTHHGKDKLDIYDVEKHISLIESVQKMRQSLGDSSDNIAFTTEYMIFCVVHIFISSGYFALLLRISESLNRELKCFIKDDIVPGERYDYFSCKHSLIGTYIVLNIVLMILWFGYNLLVVFDLAKLTSSVYKWTPDTLKKIDVEPLSGDFKILFCLAFSCKPMYVLELLMFLRRFRMRQAYLIEADLKYPYEKQNEYGLIQSTLTNIKAIPSTFQSRVYDLSKFKCLKIFNSNLSHFISWKKLTCINLSTLKLISCHINALPDWSVLPHLSNLVLINCGINELPNLRVLKCLKSLDLSWNKIETFDVSQLPDTVVTVNITKNSSKLIIQGSCSSSLKYCYIDEKLICVPDDHVEEDGTLQVSDYSGYASVNVEEGGTFQWSNYSGVYVSHEVIKTRSKKPYNYEFIRKEASDEKIYHVDNDTKDVVLHVVIVSHQIQKTGSGNWKSSLDTEAKYASGELRDVLFLQKIFQSMKCNVKVYGQETQGCTREFSDYVKEIKGRAAVFIFIGDDKEFVKDNTRHFCENGYLRLRPKIALQLLTRDADKDTDIVRDHTFEDTLIEPVKKDLFLENILEYFDKYNEEDLATMLDKINEWGERPGSNLQRIPGSNEKKKFYFLQNYPWTDFQWEISRGPSKDMPKYVPRRFTNRKEINSLNNAISSVGKLCFRKPDQVDFSYQTCFRVGDKYIMTEYTDFEGVKVLSSAEEGHCEVEFPEIERFPLGKCMCFADKKSEVMIIELPERLLIKFRNRSSGLKLDGSHLPGISDGFIIGFQEDHERQWNLFVDSQCKVYGTDETAQDNLKELIDTAESYCLNPASKKEYKKWPPYGNLEKYVVVGTESSLQGYGGSPVLRQCGENFSVIALLQHRYPSDFSSNTTNGQLQFQVALPIEFIKRKLASYTDITINKRIMLNNVGLVKKVHQSRSSRETLI